LAGGVAVLASANALAGSATYTYDNLGRLTRIAYSNGVVITYTYDAAGNRTAVVTTGAPS
jgi:YD repeat-containing protein